MRLVQQMLQQIEAPHKRRFVFHKTKTTKVHSKDLNVLQLFSSSKRSAMAMLHSVTIGTKQPSYCSQKLPKK